MIKPKRKILVVDDDVHIRETVRLALQQQEFLEIEVMESKDVDSALIMLKKIMPDVVILDLHLPEKSGFDFMDIINKDKRYARTKVIMLTVDDTLKNIFKAESKGIDAYYFLGKPFNITDLQTMVLRLCLPVKA